MHWYQLEIDKVLSDLNTSESGLSEIKVREHQKEFGLNRLAEAEKISRLKILLHQFQSPLIYILLVAGVVTFFLEEYKDTGVIAGILLINAVIGYIQEVKAEKQVQALKKMVVAKARVIRDGKETRDQRRGSGARRHRLVGFRGAGAGRCEAHQDYRA